MGHNHGYGHAGGSGSGFIIKTKNTTNRISGTVGQWGWSSYQSAKSTYGGSGGNTVIKCNGGQATAYGGSGGSNDNTSKSYANGGFLPTIDSGVFDTITSVIGNYGYSTGYINDGGDWDRANGGEGPIEITAQETPYTLVYLFISKYFEVARKIVFKYGIYPWKLTSSKDSTLYALWKKSNTLQTYKSNYSSVMFNTVRGYTESLACQLLGSNMTVGKCPGTIELINLNKENASVGDQEVWINSGNVIRINPKIYRKSISQFIVSNGTCVRYGCGVSVAYKTWSNAAAESASYSDFNNGFVKIEISH